MNAQQRERLRKLIELRSQMHDIYITQHTETIQLMRRRHAYYSALIKNTGIMTAVDFYNHFREHFTMYGVDLTLDDDMSTCTIYLNLGDYDYEKYLVSDGKDGKLAEISSNVSFKKNCCSTEANIFEDDTI